MNFKSNKGVTLMALTITIIVMLIISSTIIYNTKSHIGMEKINKLFNDIENINSKIDDYYIKYGDIPTIGNVYCTKSELIDILMNNCSDGKATLSTFDGVVVNPNDSLEYYIIDLEKLDGLMLNYGYMNDYNNVKQAIKNGTEITDITSYDDVYIINKATHQIYYPSGIFVDEFMHYSYNLDTNKQADELPSEYQRVEYIESNANQYINTEVLSSSNIRLETEIMGEYANSSWYGARTTHYIGIFNYNGRFDWLSDTEGAGVSIQVNPTTDEWHTISHGQKLFIDNKLITEFNKTDYTSDFNIYLFAGNNKGAASYFASIKMKTTQIYKNDLLIRNFIPCYRISDNVIGMYDTVGSEFYTNSGTGTFSIGNIVN